VFDWKHIYLLLVSNSIIKWDVLYAKRINLTFIGPSIVNIFQYICNKMQLYTVYLYLETCRAISRYK